MLFGFFYFILKGYLSDSNTRLMKISISTTRARFYSTVAIIMALISFSLPSCAANHKSCEAYQNVELISE